VATRSVPFLRAVGARIRDIRRRAGVSQEALAAEAGIDRSYMSGVERGARNFSVLKLHALARALRVPVRELLPPD
jgi:transcriptional regulator with XRE-family HTH domain